MVREKTKRGGLLMVNISKLKVYIDKGYIKKRLFNWEADKNAPQEAKDLLKKINNQYNNLRK